MQKVLVAVSGAMVLIGAVVTHAGAARPPGSTDYPVSKVEFRDLEGDVARSDGAKTYEGGEVAGRLVDRSESTDPDVALLQPGHKRRFRIQSPAVNGGVPTTCEAFSIIWVESHSTPDWYHADSAAGDAYFRCHEGAHKTQWIVSYPGGQAGGPGPECIQITRLNETTWRFAAPASVLGIGCSATITRETRQGSTVQMGVSAPFEVTAYIAGA